MLDIKKSPLFYLSLLSIYSTVFSAYAFLDTTLVGILIASVVILINVDKISFRPIEWFFFIFLFLYILSFVLWSNSSVVILQNSKYWFGLFLYLLFFKAYPNFSIISIYFFRILCFSILFEAVLINTVLEVSFLHGSGFHGHGGMFGFQRPYGFSGDPSTSSSIIVSLLYLIEIYSGKKPCLLDFILLFGTVIISMSLTGVIIFMLYIIARRGLNLQQLVKIIPIVLLVIYWMSLNSINTMQYFSVEYFLYIMDIKSNQINIHNIVADNILLGNQPYSDIPVTASDFGWFNMIETVGLAGFIIYILGVYLFYGVDNRYLPVLILMFIASFHYPAAFQPAGQIIVAIILSLSVKYNLHYWVNNKI